MTFDFDKLREMVRAKKKREGLRLRDIEEELGVSDSTICRFLTPGRKARIDLDNAARLAEWLGLSIDYFGIGEEPHTSDGDTLTNISDVIYADTALDADARTKLMDIMRPAYNALAGK